MAGIKEESRTKSLRDDSEAFQRSGSAAQKAVQGISNWHKIAPAFCVSLPGKGTGYPANGIHLKVNSFKIYQTAITI